MGDDNANIKYSGTATKARWRALYLIVETKAPKHKASIRWLSAAAAELFDVAEVKIKTGGVVTAKAFDGKQAEAEIKMSLTRDAVLGIRYAVIGKLTGEDTGKPANMLERRDLLETIANIGPNGILLKQVEKESKLPEDDDVDENELLSEPEKEEEDLLKK